MSDDNFTKPCGPCPQRVFFGELLEKKEVEQVKKLSNKGSLQFTLNLHKTLVEDVGDTANLFYSPFTITAALAMTYAGARGKTAEELAEFMKLYFSVKELESSEAVHKALADIFATLNLIGRTYNFTLHCANRMYLQQGHEILQKYASTLSKHYGTEPQQVDFYNDAKPTRVAINRWVEEVTRNKIVNLIGQGVIKCDTRMVLVNAMYFKGAWKKPFDESLTVDDDFYRSFEDKIRVKMMCIKGKFRFSEDVNFGCRFLQLPYAGDQLCMYVILPDAVDGLASLEQKLTPKIVYQLMSSAFTVQVKGKFPKFQLAESFHLADTLQEMGIRDLFQPGKADLSGIDGNRDLHVSDVIHKAFVEVNEKGTEAAAVLRINGCNSLVSHPEMTFVADHPFMFFICDRLSDLILFVGRVTNPVISSC